MRSNRSRPALGSKNILYKFLYLSAAFTNQTNHNNVSHRSSGHHAEKNRFTDSGTGKKSHTLTFAYGNNTVDRLNSDIQIIFNLSAGQRIQSFGNKMNIGRSYYRTETVKRRTYTVNNSAEKLRTERDLTGLPQRNNLCARYNTLHFLRRHQIQFITGKADYLGIQIAVAGINTADGTHGGATAYRL